MERKAKTMGIGMNTRIKELAVQALENSLFESIDPSLSVGEGQTKVTIPLVFVEKFAELIVQECLDVLNPDDDLTSMREEYGRKLSMHMIKKHFGVE